MDRICCSSPQPLEVKTAVIQLLPFGKVDTDKGSFLVDELALKELIKSFQNQTNNIVIDYEHQTLKDVIAPAGGWIKQLENRSSAGLWALVEWTPKAKGLISCKEYRYISPVVLVRKSDNRAIRLHSAGLTNTPAIDGMTPIAAKSGMVMIGSLDPMQKQINDRLGIADMVYLKYSNIQDELYSLSSKGTEETQQRINHLLGVSQEDFAKYGS